MIFVIFHSTAEEATVNSIVRINNAAGTCKTVEQLKKLIGAVDDVATIGSIVVDVRAGNDGLPYYRQPDVAQGSVNKLGIPSRGLEYYRKNLPLMVEIAKANGKKLAASIASLNPGELGVLTRLCGDTNVDIVEVNVGCAHLKGKDGKQKPLPSYNPRMLDAGLAEVESAVRPEQKLRVKLSPYFDSVLIEEVASVLKTHPRFTPVFCNTLPNILMRRAEDRVPAIKGDGLAGHGGSDVFRWVVCGVIRQFQEHLPGRRMIGVGGISKGVHLLDYTDLGITDVQVATAYYDSEDPHVFSDIRQEYADQLINLNGGDV